MANLDVTEILCDPDFMDQLVCIRYSQTVDIHGRAANASTSIPFYGVATSNQGDVLERIATGERIKGSITIHSMFLLRDGSGQGQTADEVQFNGQTYTVSNVNSYSHFGAGFTAANCDIKPVSG